MTNQEAVNLFTSEMKWRLTGKYEIDWEVDNKGVTIGWCRLENSGDIYNVAECVAGMHGRVMTISPLVTAVNEKDEHVEINYHFYFNGVNCTARIVLPTDDRKIVSITPVLKSADWHEREMSELYKIEVKGHPNPNKLFLDDSINMTENTMIPLSEAMSGASTSTLWEKIMQSNSKGGEKE